MAEDVFGWFITRLLKTLNTVWNSELAGGARKIAIALTIRSLDPAYGTGTMAKAGIKQMNNVCDRNLPSPIHSSTLCRRGILPRRVPKSVDLQPDF